MILENKNNEEENSAKNNSRKAVSATDILPDSKDYADFNGRTIRKGTVAAFVTNVLEYENSNSARKEELLQSLLEAKKDLDSIGVLKVFKLRNKELDSLFDQRN